MSTTLDPAYTNANVTLGGGNLSAQTFVDPGGAWLSVATTAKSTGRWWIEIRADWSLAVGQRAVGVGFISDAERGNLAQSIAAKTNGVVYYSNGDVVGKAGVFSNSSASRDWKSGGGGSFFAIQADIDMDAGIVRFYRDKFLQFQADNTTHWTKPSGLIYPCFEFRTFDTDGHAQIWAVRFSNPDYSPVAGAKVWDSVASTQVLPLTNLRQPTMQNLSLHHRNL